MSWFSKTPKSQDSIIAKRLMADLELSELKSIWKRFVKDSEPKFKEVANDGLETFRPVTRTELIESLASQVSPRSIVKIYPNLQPQLTDLTKGE